MKIEIPAGRYIVAVSGGVDSMVLLALLAKMPDLELIIAHFNHGIRNDAAVDARLVAEAAKSYNLPYELGVAPPGTLNNEANARKARYRFLRQICKKYNAEAIVTAHHKDDLVETAVINILRGTGWRGIAPFVSATDLQRPLLLKSKKQLHDYALQHAIVWHEDTTNKDQKYRRNYIRHRLIPHAHKISVDWQQDLLRHIRNQQHIASKIDELTSAYLNHKLTVIGGSASLLRYDLIMLPRSVAHEIMQALFRHHIGHSLPRPQIEAILIFAKTASRGKLMPVSSHWQCRTTLREFIVEPRTPVVS